MSSGKHNTAVKACFDGMAVKRRGKRLTAGEKVYIIGKELKKKSRAGRKVRSFRKESLEINFQILISMCAKAHREV